MEKLMLFDTHLHLIYPDRLTYPWLDNAPLLNKPSLYPNYEKLAGRLGITGCFHMEVDVTEQQIKEETNLINELTNLYIINSINSINSLNNSRHLYDSRGCCERQRPKQYM